MFKAQEFTLVGAGPTGSDLYRFTANGMLDVVGNRMFTPYDIVHTELLAASVDKFIWVCHEGVWVVASVAEAHTVVGGSGATATVVVCPQGVAVASGTAQLSAAFDLTVTAPAKAFGTLIATPTEMRRGDVLAVDMAGTLTGLVGCLSILLKRIG